MHPPERRQNESPSHPEPSPTTGVLVLDKPLHKTSRAVCTLVRTRLIRAGAPKRIKVGHAGTLDPLATGVMIILVGGATRLCDRFMLARKVYLADIDLAHNSSTHDLESTPIPARVDRIPTGDDIVRALAGFVGVIQQRPPAHSAMKVGGKRAYELARRGQEPPLAPRPVRIDAIDIRAYSFPYLRLEITCGKGTYIRSLAHDLGVPLYTGGMLVALRRLAVGPFTTADAHSPTSLPPHLHAADLLALDHPLVRRALSDDKALRDGADSADSK